ncbi:hypothetical protein [uncultured Pontibacter sp.]|uniref:hypothetical protein n=1 Tax=uncultured Pontibacter sp. TaxID=453356 RepID=UPI00261DAC14|nr:hypothetical protein [uncultured Pontibacter sp.]
MFSKFIWAAHHHVLLFHVICIVPYAVKNILLTLTLFFACFGWQQGMAVEVSATELHAPAAQGELARVDKGELYHSPGLLQAEEQVRVLQPRPTASLKHSSNGFQSFAEALEFRLRLRTTLYLQRAERFSPGLRTLDIIFPFHYFW